MTDVIKLMVALVGSFLIIGLITIAYCDFSQTTLDECMDKALKQGGGCLDRGGGHYEHIRR